jgi:50S ribosomal protein uL3
MLTSLVRHASRRAAPPAAALCKARAAPLLIDSVTDSLVRSYSSSKPLYSDKDSDKEKKPIVNVRYQTINNTQYTDEDLDAMFEEAEKELAAEELAKTYPNWKPGMIKRPRLFFRSEKELLYSMYPDQYPTPWTLLDHRCGGLAIKVGMMGVYDEWGERHACTVLLMDRNVVIGNKTEEKHGYNAVQVAAGERKRKNVGKCLMGQYKGLLDYLEFKENGGNDNGDGDSAEHSESTVAEGAENENEASPEGEESTETLTATDASSNSSTTTNGTNKKKTIHPPYIVREFRVTDAAHLIPVNTQIHARHFVPGQNVDVAGISKGKGFQGGMKRHNFGGMPASHGVSLSQRAIGSVGQCQDPGRVFKGKKMPGRMGTDRVTKQNLRVIKIDIGRNLIFVKGGVPGQNGNFVEIRDAVKRPLWETKKVLGEVDRPPLPTFAYEAIDGCGRAGHEVFMPLPAIDPLNPELNNNDQTAI